MGQSSAPTREFPFDIGVGADNPACPTLYAVVVRNNVLHLIVAIFPFVNIGWTEDHARLWRTVDFRAFLTNVLFVNQKMRPFIQLVLRHVQLFFN